MVGFCKTFIRITEDMVIILFDVVGLVVVNQVTLGLHGFFRIAVCGQKFVFDVDQFQCAFGNGFIYGGDAGHVVPDVTDFVDRERVLVMADGQNAVRIRSVGSNDDADNSVDLLGAASIDALDARMRMRGMQNFAGQHPRDGEVVGVLAGTGGLTSRIDHGDRFTDDGELTHMSIANWNPPKLLCCCIPKRNASSSPARKKFDAVALKIYVSGSLRLAL